MKLVVETTEWSGPVPNNFYLVSDDINLCFGYMPKGHSVATKFKNPIRFDTRGRKFKIIIKYSKSSDQNQKIITGSKGQEYVITGSKHNMQCSCPGFQYRGKCRHVVDSQ